MYRAGFKKLRMKKCAPSCISHSGWGGAIHLFQEDCADRARCKDNHLGYLPMQEIVDHYSSSSASTAQRMSGEDNHLCAKIERGCVPPVQYATPLVEKYPFHTPPLACFKSSQNSIYGVRTFHKRPVRFVIANEPVSRSHRSIPEKLGGFVIRRVRNCCSYNIRASRPFPFDSQYVRCMSAIPRTCNPP
ncbi:hypothetical protein TNIN_218521 [Trichonephila inaurata madagascariensis]|uniref:Uncharacterized protein n=1 Tax=Trichonephila inaurata madagascariensis TaxID=2747483 RepID=A0A8X6YTD7_9ARAC|nr:hypothetical protein TNIN_22481 [Trichonephila inaurata madagascariensis]GFY78083.1 hypothetical protein TNIN_218521 [Trichonephila inaurata madagascariensis]